MMNVLWFSPLPPARTDIANFSARLASPLRKLVDVTFVQPERTGEGSVSIASLSARQINSADLCVYQMGNDARFHGAIFEVAQRHPGLVMLHDRGMQEFMLSHYGSTQKRTGIAKFTAYRRAMGRWHGSEGLEAAALVERGRYHPSQFVDRFPLFEAILERALGAVCHNPLVLSEVQRRFPRLPAIALPLPFQIPEVRPPRPVHTPEAPIQLVMFGFMAANRRATEFLEIWAKSQYRDRFHLQLAGQMAHRGHFDALAAQLGLSGQISHHGFVEEEQLDALIRGAHMAINLRNPTMGEASGSQLRIWANGCPSVVSRTGWYASLPDRTVRKINSNDEQADILLLLSDLVEGRIDLEGMAASGFEQLREHDPERYVRNLLAWFDMNGAGIAERWSEQALMDALARAYAGSLPLDMDVTLPPRLLA